MKKELQQRIDELLMTLSSAYQEEAIQNELEVIEEYEDSQKFANDCCDTYREILKQAGYTGMAIYKAFRKYGDECEVQSVAIEVFKVIRGVK